MAVSAEAYQAKVSLVLDYLLTEFPENSIGHRFDANNYTEAFLIHMDPQRHFSVSVEFLNNNDPDTIGSVLRGMDLSKIIRSSTKQIELTNDGLRYT